MNSLSAASPTLPLPSYVRVTNLNNHRSIVVRVNDRGPYVGNRLIDVSVKTAKLLGFYGQGVTKVKVEYVGRAPLAGSDDRKLAATLRERDACRHRTVQVASAETLRPDLFRSAPDGAPSAKRRRRPTRPYALGEGAPSRNRMPRAAPRPSNLPPPRGRARPARPRRFPPMPRYAMMPLRAS